MERITSLPSAPQALFTSGKELVLVFAQALTVWDGRKLNFLLHGNVGGAAPGPDGRIYCTQDVQIIRLSPQHPFDPEDLTSSFGGSPQGRRRVGGTPDGSIWVEGCARLQELDCSFHLVPAPPCPGPAPVPLTVDLYGNAWSLTDAQQPALLPANAPQAWQIVPLEGGPWEFLAADSVGFVWVAGRAGLRRFDPRCAEAGWKETAAGLPSSAITALGLSPDDLLLAGFASGEVLEVEVDSEGSLLTRPLAHAPGPVRSTHADAQGALWIATDEELYCCPPAAHAWQHTWEKRGRLPGGNHDIFAAPLQGKLYVAGGLTSEWGCPAGWHVFEELWAWEPGSSCWERVSRMSFPRRYNGIAALDGRIWVVGGEGLFDLSDPKDKRVTVDVVEIYDPATHTWTTGPSLNTVRTDPFVMVCGGRIWAVGGACDPRTPLATVESIAPGEKKWRFEPSLPVPTRQGGCCALAGVLYCMSTEGFFAFDTATGQWDPDLPQLEKSPMAPLMTAFAGQVWVMGGWLSRATYCYSPGERKWHPGPPLPTEQSWGAAAVLDNQLVIVGGAHRCAAQQKVVYDDRTYVLRSGSRI